MNIGFFSVSLPRKQYLTRMAVALFLIGNAEFYESTLAQNDSLNYLFSTDTTNNERINPLRAVQEEDNEEMTYTNSILPPSPQAAALARYGEYPISLATGVPQINIPLYEIRLGNYTLPVSISYHASGIKVDDIASTVGLGWVLNAGGAVSRTIIGAPDFRDNKSETQDTLYRSFSRFNYRYYYSSAYDDVLLSIFTDGQNYDYDTASDRYSYNFGTKAGVFRYSHEKRKFVDLNHHPVWISLNNRDNSFFTIIDTDGTEYIFRDKETTLMQGDPMNSTNDYMAPTTWYLTQINTQHGSIKFTYRHADAYTTSTFSETFAAGLHYYYAGWNEGIGEIYKAQHGKHNSVFNHSTLLLNTIEWNGNKILFSYSNDRRDIAPERLTDIVIRGCDGTVYKSITLDNDYYMGNSDNNYRMMLRSISVSDEGKYSFSYEMDKLLPDYGCIGRRDYWGYYNTDSSYIYHVDRFAAKAAIRQFHEMNSSSTYGDAYFRQFANRMPDFNFGKTGILKKIIYPTGGHTNFTYEQNYADGGTPRGGLRILTITDSDASSNIAHYRHFNYSGFATEESPRESAVYDTYHGYRDVTPRTVYMRKATCSSESLVPLCDGNGSSVFYDYVTETDFNNNTIEYHYLYGGLVDPAPWYLNESWPQLRSESTNDEGTCAPLLISKKYKENGTLVRTEEYEYEKICTDTIEVGVKYLNIVSVSSVYGRPTEVNINDIKSVPTPFKRMVGFHKVTPLKSKTVTDNLLGISTTETYTYDPFFRTLQPKTVTTFNSDGKAYRTVNEYTFECNDAISRDMADNYNMVDKVTAVRQYADNTFLMTDSTLYIKHNDWFYPKKMFKKNLNNSLYEILHISEYDNNGNPLTVIENQTDQTAFIWGFKSSVPVARVMGRTYSYLKNSLGLSTTLSNIASDSIPSRMTGYLNTLRNAIGNNGLVTTYNYKPLYGPSVITAENGYTIYYDYGAHSHLSAIRDVSGPLQQFTYQYYYPFSGSTTSDNYVNTQQMLNTSTGIHIRQYYDGLGRPTQKATGGLNTQGCYVYTQQDYDQNGRVCREWLPTVGNNSPTFVSNISNLANATYQDNFTYSTSTYDVLDRPVFKSMPGSDWDNGTKGMMKAYVTNAAGSVRHYVAPLNENSLQQLGLYAAKTLYGETTTDPDGHTITVFHDKLGRKVLERRDGNSDTYFVYDDLGQLRFVLSPAYNESGFKETYGYEYRYDSKGRLEKKILPQCENIRYWYDKAGRLKYIQDATLRGKGLFRFLVYDKYGRLCLQGTCNGNCDRGNGVNKSTYSNTLYGFLGTGYSLSRTDDLSEAQPQLEQVFYYDTYNYQRLYTDYPLTQSSMSDATGLPTGHRQAASDGTQLFSACYYDPKGRVTDTRTISLENRLTTTHTDYTYSGQVQAVTQNEYASNGATLNLTAILQNNYHATSGLLTSTTLSLKAGTGTAVTKTIQTLVYDSIGHVRQNTRSGLAGSIGYTYNLQGWTKTINGKGFKEWLYYADAPNGATACYNGNISVQKWLAAGDSYNRGYKFTYDSQNRLTNAIYGESDFTKHDNRYTEQVLLYSPNSVMRRFQRHGLKSNGVYGKIDNLHITLSGNRLMKITDDANPQTHYGAFEFLDGANSATEYYYDDAGALVCDANKGIAHITYDNLNYPREIQFTNGNLIRYVYSPSGEKLRTTYVTAIDNIVVPLNSTLSLSTSQIQDSYNCDYNGGILYERGTLSKYLFPGGYATFPTTTTSTLHYFTKDHLGNNRAVVNEDGTIEQVIHYYPFGGVFADAGINSGLQKYKYNGKELDRMHGLDWYDYGHRRYDAIVPLFTQVDPMAEKYYHLSPYVYCGSNPVNAIDMNGDSIIYENNNIIYTYKMDGNDSGFYNQQGFLLERPFANVLSNALKTIQDGEEGYKLVKYLSTASKKVKIDATNEDSWTSYNKGKVSIHWNPDDYQGAGIDVWGGTETPPYITLSHELFHAKDYIRYGASNQMAWYHSPNGIVRMSEYFTCINENMIRAEHHLPLRRYYSTYNNGEPYIPSLIPIYTVFPLSLWGRSK